MPTESLSVEQRYANLEERVGTVLTGKPELSGTNLGKELDDFAREIELERVPMIYLGRTLDLAVKLNTYLNERGY